MNHTIVLAGGGIKSAAAAACQPQGTRLTFLHVAHGQKAASAELEATQRQSEGFEERQIIEIDLDYPVQLQQRIGGVATIEGQQESGVVGTYAIENVPISGTWPAMIWAGIQCAIRMGANRVVSGLSRKIDALHLGMPPIETRKDRLADLIYDLNSAASYFAPSKHPVQIELPLLDRTYAEIIKLAVHVGVDLQGTWSCTEAIPPRGKQRTGCGKCASCNARAAAFINARFVDPAMATPKPAAS
ncbi:MAG: 7-cyano-7-deazaguanine synthase [Planctomycetota bacterium]|jgi:7-cyano-7-deazaguanine synthase in queuosine biosynthesis